MMAIQRSGNSELLGCFLPAVYSKSSNPIHQSQNRNQRLKIKKKLNLKVEKIKAKKIKIQKVY